MKRSVITKATGEFPTRLAAEMWRDRQREEGLIICKIYDAGHNPFRPQERYVATAERPEKK